jgi:hypothetical protein
MSPIPVPNVYHRPYPQPREVETALYRPIPPDGVDTIRCAALTVKKKLKVG